MSDSRVADSSFRWALGLLLSMTALPASAQSFTEASGLFSTPPDGSRALYGASLVDVNRDGVTDLYHPSRLYLRTAEGRFEDVLASDRFEGIDGSEVFGGVFADADADGFPDLYVEDYDPGSRYFRSRFGIRWDVVDAETGIDMRDAQSQGASWGDYDGDGDLDLFVGEEFGNNRFFENLGGGRFTWTPQASIENDRHSYGVAAADYDRDGDLDIFIAACYTGSPELSRNMLFRNEGDGTFIDVGAEAGVDDTLAGWASIWLDYDRDGWPDMFVANMPIYGPDARPGYNKLYRNNGDGTFADVSEAAGVAGGEDDFGFGAAVADFDNDGWEDIWIANDPFGGTQGGHRLLRNLGNGTFEDQMPLLDLLPINGTIAMAAADLNQDGWVDAVTASRSGHRVFLNDAGINHWMRVRLRGTEENLDAVGAGVTAYIGSTPLWRQITAGDGMTSQNHDFTAHFGLGESAGVDSLVVEWPSGAREKYTNLSVDRLTHLAEGVGETAPPPPPVLTSPLNGASAEGETTFIWDPGVTTQGGSTTYDLAILSTSDRSPTGELIRRALSTESESVDLSSLADGDYVWTVVANTGHWARAASESFEFRIGMPTATEPAPELPGLAVYPNPARNVLRVEGLLAPGEMEVFDLAGRRVLRKSLGAGGSLVDVSELPVGGYLVRVGGSVVPVVLLR